MNLNVHSGIWHCTVSILQLSVHVNYSYYYFLNAILKKKVAEDDDHGLKINAKLIDTQSNRDIYKSIQAGLLDKMSFAFTVANEEYDYETDTRKILAFDKIFDVSVVDVPAYDTTEIYARSKDEYELDKLNYAKQKAYDKLGL